MPVKPVTDADYVGNSIKYPNPFFDLANNFIPKNIKTLFSNVKVNILIEIRFWRIYSMGF